MNVVRLLCIKLSSQHRWCFTVCPHFELEKSLLSFELGMNSNWDSVNNYQKCLRVHSPVECPKENATSLLITQSHHFNHQALFLILFTQKSKTKI